MSIALLFRAHAGQAAFLEPWLSHVVAQFSAWAGRRTLVIEPAPARGQPRPPAQREWAALVARLRARGTLDQIVDARGAPPGDLEPVRRCFAPSSAPDRAWLSAAGSPWGVLFGLETAPQEHALVLEAPVFFHVGAPSWVEQGLERLHPSSEIWGVRAAHGPPPPAGARSTAPRGGSVSGYFLCQKTRLLGRLDARTWFESGSSFERWFARSLPESLVELAGGGWAVRVASTQAPFPACAEVLGEAVASGRYPEPQRGRYDIRWDRAAEREAWSQLLKVPACRAPPPPVSSIEGSRHVPSRLEPRPSGGSIAPARPGTLRAVLLAPYLTRNGNPLLGRPTYRADCAELVEPWWSDVDRIGVEARIFHDDLSPEFVGRFSTPRIGFERCTIPPGVSCNDYRFLLFRDWLRRHTEVEFAFCTDLFDLRVKRNPFEVLQGRYVYAGAQPVTIGENRYVQAKLARAYQVAFPELDAKVVLNAGILGGPRDLLLPCLDALAADLEAAFTRRPSGNYNMGVFNRVLHGLDRVWACGEPLHSRFRAHDFGADVCFIHK